MSFFFPPPHKNNLIKGWSDLEDIPAYKIFIHLTSSNLRQFEMIEGTGLQV